MKENKKKQSMLQSRSFFIALVVITSLLVITVAMNLLLPEEESLNAGETEAWERAVEQAAKTYDDGLNSVYHEDAIAVNSTAAPTPATNAPEETAPAEATESAAPSTEEPSADTAPKAVLLLNPVAGSIGKDFSAEDLQYSDTMEDWRVHDGIDFTASEGTEVTAAADGTVKAVTEDPMLGTTVLISHADGIDTFYANLQENPAVTEGTPIKAGDAIGKVGKTAALEIMEPSHLHFEVLRGEERLNPHDFLSDTVTDDE